MNRMSGEAKSFWSSFGEYFPLEMRAAAENALMAPSQITINKQENILRRRVTNLKQLKEHIAQSLKSGSSDAAATATDATRSEANESTSSSSDSSATEPSAAPAATEPSAASAASAAPASAAAASEQAASRSTTGSSVKSPVGLYNGGKRSKKTKQKKRKQRKTQRKKRLL